VPERDSAAPGDAPFEADGATAVADADAHADADVADTAVLDAMDVVETSGDMVVWSNNFDSPSDEAQWSFANTAGFDDNKGYAHSPPNNGWVNTGTLMQAVGNSIRARVSPGVESRSCTASAFIAASSNIVPGMAEFDVLGLDAAGSSTGEVLSEIVLARGDGLGTYVQYVTDRFAPPTGGDVLIEFGIFGPTNSQWIRIDDVVLQCSAH
jgi:hypothetical protein